MNDIYIRGIELPSRVKGITVLDENGDFNVYINILLSFSTQQCTTNHEIKHIKLEHFYNFEPVIYNELEVGGQNGII